MLGQGLGVGGSTEILCSNRVKTHNRRRNRIPLEVLVQIGISMNTPNNFLLASVRHPFTTFVFRSKWFCTSGQRVKNPNESILPTTRLACTQSFWFRHFSARGFCIGLLPCNNNTTQPWGSPSHGCSNVW